MPTRVCSIINSEAGRGLNKQEMNWLEKQILKHFPDSEILVPEKEGKSTARLARLAQESGVQRIYVFGGDGTTNQVVNGLKPYDRRLAIGVVPMGTGNDFARGLGMPGNISKAIEVLKRDVSQTIDLGSANGSLFVNTVSLGLDAEINSRALRLKPFLRKLLRLPILAYIPTILGTLLVYKGFPEVVVEINGKSFFKGQITMLTITNSPGYASGLKINPNAKLDDSLLDLCLLKKTSKPALYRHAWEVYRGTHIRRKNGFLLKQFFQLLFESQKLLFFQLDGEDCGLTNRVEVSVVPKALRVIVNERLIPSSCFTEDGSSFY